MAQESGQKGEPAEKVILPVPKYDGKLSIERALRERRSVRDYAEKPLRIEEISQLLWAAQGITGPSGMRTAPSAGALYPLEVYLVVGNVEGVPVGVYKYRPQTHALEGVAQGDRRAELSEAALGQYCISEGAVVVVIAAVYERTTRKYGERGIRYVHAEVGHAAQNIYLQAVSLNLGTVFVGAFHDDDVREVMNMPNEERPLCIMPIGRMR